MPNFEQVPPSDPSAYAELLIAQNIAAKEAAEAANRAQVIQGRNDAWYGERGAIYDETGNTLDPSSTEPAYGVHNGTVESVEEYRSQRPLEGEHVPSLDQSNGSSDQEAKSSFESAVSTKLDEYRKSPDYRAPVDPEKAKVHYKTLAEKLGDAYRDGDNVSAEAVSRLLDREISKSKANVSTELNDKLVASKWEEVAKIVQKRSTPKKPEAPKAPEAPTKPEAKPEEPKAEEPKKVEPKAGEPKKPEEPAKPEEPKASEAPEQKAPEAPEPKAEDDAEELAKARADVASALRGLVDKKTDHGSDLGKEAGSTGLDQDRSDFEEILKAYVDGLGGLMSGKESLNVNSAKALVALNQLLKFDRGADKPYISRPDGIDIPINPNFAWNVTDIIAQRSGEIRLLLAQEQMAQYEARTSGQTQTRQPELWSIPLTGRPYNRRDFFDHETVERMLEGFDVTKIGDVLDAVATVDEQNKEAEREVMERNAKKKEGDPKEEPVKIMPSVNDVRLITNIFGLMRLRYTTDHRHGEYVLPDGLSFIDMGKVNQEIELVEASGTSDSEKSERIKQIQSSAWQEEQAIAKRLIHMYRVVSDPYYSSVGDQQLDEPLLEDDPDLLGGVSPSASQANPIFGVPQRVSDPYYSSVGDQQLDEPLLEDDPDLLGGVSPSASQSIQVSRNKGGSRRMSLKSMFKRITGKNQ